MKESMDKEKLDEILESMPLLGQENKWRSSALNHRIAFIPEKFVFDGLDEIMPVKYLECRIASPTVMGEMLADSGLILGTVALINSKNKIDVALASQHNIISPSDGTHSRHCLMGLVGLFTALNGTSTYLLKDMEEDLKICQRYKEEMEKSCEVRWSELCGKAVAKGFNVGINDSPWIVLEIDSLIDDIVKKIVNRIEHKKLMKNAAEKVTESKILAL